MIGHQNHRTKGYITLGLPALFAQVAPSTSGVELRLKATRGYKDCSRLTQRVSTILDRWYKKLKKRKLVKILSLRL